MNEQEMWKQLHEICSGDKKKKDSTIAEYEYLPPEEGYIAAKSYLESAKRGQDRCQSDWSYWLYEGDITKAIVLMNIFDALRKGKKEFPEIGDVGVTTMDKTDHLQKWSESLVSSKDE